MDIYLNSQFVDEARATVSVFDRGFLYGDGVFETMRAYDGRVAWLEPHLERLFQSARMIDLRIERSKTVFTSVIRDLIDRNALGHALIRITMTRGVGPPGLDLGPKIDPTTVITARPYTPYSPACYSAGVSLAIVSIRRNPPESMPPSIKSLNFLNNILAKAEATRKGAFDGLMLNRHHHLTEATTSNLFLVRKGELYTPAIHCGILPGITRDAVLSLARADGTACHEEPLPAGALDSADECFLTNTSMEIMPVTRVDTRIIGTGRPGPMTTHLQDAFRQHIDRHFREC